MLIVLLVNFRICDMSMLFFFLMIRRPPRSTLDRSSAASDVYKRQGEDVPGGDLPAGQTLASLPIAGQIGVGIALLAVMLSLIHISEPTRPY